MNRNLPSLIFTIYTLLFLPTIIFSQSENIEPWKNELQLLLGFQGEELDGVMGRATFNSLKEFSEKNDLTDVVMRGEYDDLGFWGFQQYLIKYNEYWIREIKNNKIINDVMNKEYIIQANDALYSFEVAIQEAQSEVDRLVRAKTKSKRLAEEKQQLENWEIEKREAERLTSSLKQAILEAEIEAEKWAIERMRAKRLAEEKEQLDALEIRKAEAKQLTDELEGIVFDAKSEIDRLVNENQEMKELIDQSNSAKSLAIQLKEQLSQTQINIDSLTYKNIILSEELNLAKLEIIKLKDVTLENDIDTSGLLNSFNFNFNTGLVSNNSIINGNIDFNFGLGYNYPASISVLDKIIKFDSKIVHRFLKTDDAIYDEFSTYFLMGTYTNIYKSLLLKFNSGFNVNILDIEESIKDYIFQTEIKYPVYTLKMIKFNLNFKHTMLFNDSNKYQYPYIGIEATIAR